MFNFHLVKMGKVSSQAHPVTYKDITTFDPTSKATDT
jgi:hypothetical protein